MQIQCVTAAMPSSALGGYKYPSFASQPCVGNSPAPSRACCRTSSLHTSRMYTCQYLCVHLDAIYHCTCTQACAYMWVYLHTYVYIFDKYVCEYMCVLQSKAQHATLKLTWSTVWCPVLLVLWFVLFGICLSSLLLLPFAVSVLQPPSTFLPFLCLAALLFGVTNAAACRIQPWKSEVLKRALPA